MDGRGALRLSLCLLISAAGCQQEVVSLPNSTSLTSFWGNPDPHQIKKASPRPEDLPPLVRVSHGNFEAGEAFSDRTGPERRQQLCESARTDYERALALDPKCLPAYQGLARLYTHMHDLPLAVETYQKALKFAPNNASLWFELGLCQNYQKNLAPALECLDRAAQLEPGNHSYTNALGVVLAESGRYDESLRYFSRAGGEAMGYYRLAQTLSHLQRPELSRRYLEVALQKDPSLAPPIQQASYQPATSPETIISPAPTVPPEPSLPPAASVSSEPSAPPTQTASPEPNAPPTQVLVPPVPPIHEEEEQPNP